MVIVFSFYKNSVVAAESVIDNVCENGAVVLYDAYLRPKVKPYELRLRSMSASEAC